MQCSGERGGRAAASERGGRTGLTLWREGHAVDDGVRAGIAQPQRGLHEHALQPGGGVHADEALFEVADLGPGRLVHAAGGGRVLGGHDLAVPRHQAAARRQSQVGGGADGQRQVARARRRGEAPRALVQRRRQPPELAHLAGLVALRRLLPAVAAPPRRLAGPAPAVGQLQPAVVVVLGVRVHVGGAVARGARDVARQVGVDVGGALRGGRAGQGRAQRGGV